MNVAPVELVVGADGMIGAALLRGLSAAGRNAIGTSRRSDANERTIHLDLADPPAVWNGPPVGIAYICAAVARLDACRNDPNGSARVNVAGTVRLARLLAAQGAFVVYLSTNHVFDGTLPYRRPDEAACPVNEYGRQKAAAEEQILGLGKSSAVVRLTKIVGERLALFDGWVAALHRGERIRPFLDMSMAPVPLYTVVEVLAALGPRHWAGVHHLSGNRDVTYAKIARSLAGWVGVDAALIAPVPALAADPSADPPPRYTTLDLADLPARLGITMPDVEETIHAALQPAPELTRQVA